MMVERFIFIGKELYIMLKINHIYIHYNQLVLDIPKLSFSIGLNIIKGESGCGKSSLLRCLSLQEDTCQEYLFNGKPVRNKEKFQKEHISFLSQSPIFIDDMTVNDHIQLMNRVFDFNELDDYIQRLELDKIMDKYPPQLSGGEKTRLGLLLMTMKDSEIFLLDEPTSSLDIDMTSVVIDILKEYARDHIVIVATHDQAVIPHADALYNIKDKTIITLENPKDKNVPAVQHEFKRISSFQFHRKLFKKRTVYYAFMYVFIALALFISSSGLSLMFTSSTQESPFTSVYEDEILIYKGSIDQTSSYSSHGIEFPLTQDEISKARQIEHIKSLNPDYILQVNSLEYFDDPIPLNIPEYTIKLLDEYEKDITPDDYTQSDFSFCGYPDESDYSQDIEVQLANEADGIYVSKSLAESLHIDESEGQYYLNFYMPIPTYQGFGDAEIPYQNEDGSYASDGVPVLRLFGTYENVTLPVNGILKKVNMGISTNTQYGYDKVFIPQSLIDEKLEENKTHETLTYYWSDLTGYGTDINESTDKSAAMICRPYEPIIYRAKMDDIQNLQYVLTELNELGLSTISANISSTQIHQYLNNTDQIIMLVALIVLVLLIVIHNVTLYLKKRDSIDIFRFLKSFGYSTFDANTTMRNKYFWDFVDLALLTVVLTALYMYVIGPVLDYPIHLDSSIYMIIIAIAFPAMFILPYSIYRLMMRREG